MSRLKFTIETKFDNSITYVESMQDAKDDIRQMCRKNNRKPSDFIIKKAQPIRMMSLALLLMIALSSCSVSKGVVVQEVTADAIITASNDTIPTRQRLLQLIREGETYKFYKWNGRIVDSSIPPKR